MRSQRQLVRVFDANLNRLREGLRVCEDLVRFCVGRPSHFRRLRAIRRALDETVKRLGLVGLAPAELVRARDSPHDPGRASRAHSVRSVEHLLLINLQRTKEALRVLEESSRLLCPRQARNFQRLRFLTYDVERDLLLYVATLRHHRQRQRSRP